MLFELYAGLHLRPETKTEEARLHTFLKDNNISYSTHKPTKYMVKGLLNQVNVHEDYRTLLEKAN